MTGEEDLLRQARALGQLAGNPLRPQPKTAPDVPIAHAGVNPFGINVFLEQEVEPAKRERSLQMIAAAGFHWIRQEFPWEDIEIHGKGDFEDRRHEPYRSAWQKDDNIVTLAEAYDLEIIARLSNPPAWTRAAGDQRGSYAPPDELEDWVDFVGAVAERYRGRIRAYQLWNEPNIYPEWGEQPVDAEAYTQLLCAGYRRIKEVDPGAIVLSGALAPTVALNPGPGPALGVSDFVFLQAMYDVGASGCFDVLAVNDYMLWSGPTDRRLQPLTINFSRPIYLRDIMVANGDASKPIWISEMNSNAVPNDPQIQGVGAYGQVTLEQQARYAQLAYQRIMEEWPWLGVANFWFFKRASDAEREQSWYYFRMVEPDFTPLPVYGAMKTFSGELTPTLYPGLHQEGHWALSYEGDWRDVDDEHAMFGVLRRSTEAGALLRFTMEGARLALVAAGDDAQIEVRVADAAPRRITIDQSAPQAVTLLRTLRTQRSVVSIRLLSGALEVDGLQVRAPWRPPAWLALALVALALVAALGAILRAVDPSVKGQRQSRG